MGVLLKTKNMFKYIASDRKKFLSSLLENFGGWVPDKYYLKMMFRLRMGKKLDLVNPITFNEKLQWLKLYNRKGDLPLLVDKYAVKDSVAKTIGSDYVIPTLGVWNDVESIDFSSLPNQFVLKTTHGGGGEDVVICRDKSVFDVEKAKAKLKISMGRSLYKRFREWPYKSVPRKIIAERYLEDDDGGLTDYKFFCFDQYVDCVMVCLDRYSGETKFYFFDEQWNLKRLNIRGKNAPADFTLKKPDCLKEMFEIAKKLSKGHPFVRVDLYNCKKKVFFGEMTFYPDAGFDSNLLAETDLYFGDKIHLPNEKRKG